MSNHQVKVRDTELANDPVSVPARHQARQSGDPQSARILVVDDEDQVRMVVARVLEDCGYTVLQARNGRDALDQLAKAEGAVDAVLTDVVMPVMGGVELARQLSVIRPDLPIISMSGYSRDAASDDGLLRDDQPFLQKPVSGEILAQTLDEVLRSRTSR